MAKAEHPNEPGKWTLIERRGERLLWRRERQDPMPQVVFYVMDLPRQTEIFYDEQAGRERLAQLSGAISANAA